MWDGEVTRLVVAVQVQGREGFPVKYTSVGQCGYRIVSEEGLGSFWRGSMCSFMKVHPGFERFMCMCSPRILGSYPNVGL